MDLIEAALENTLSRDGTSPNQMEAALDMNGQRIINLPAAVDANDAVRKADFDAYEDAAAAALAAAEAAQADADATVVAAEAALAAALVAETNAETAETNAETAQGLSEDARDLSQQYAADAAVQGGFNVPIYASVASAEAATITAGVKAIRTQFRAPTYTTPTTLIGGGEYARVSLAAITSASYPAQSYFRSTDRFMPDGSIDSTNGGYWLLTEKRPTVYMFGAVGDSVTDDSAAINAALLYATKFNPVLPVIAPAGRFLCNTSIVFLVDGQALIGAGTTQTLFLPGMTDGTACISMPAGIDRWMLEGVYIFGTINTATFTTGATSAQNCIGVEAWSTGSPFVTRFTMLDTRVRGCAKGFRIGGFSGDIERIRADYCDLGFESTLLNDTLLNLRTEACRQDMVVGNSDGLHISRLSCQGGVANEISSTFDDCRGMVLSAPYWETASTYPRSTPFAIFGGTTECTSLSVTGAIIGGSSGMQAGIYPIKLDQVNGRRFESHVADGAQGCSVLTTTNTKNIDVVIVPSQGFNRDESGIMDAAINYFPNSQFEAGLKGWRALSPVRSTISLETSGVRRGRYAVKVLATNHASAQNYCQWSLPSNVVTALRDKTIRLMVELTVPDSAAYDLATRTATPNIYLQSFNGTTTTSTSDVSARILDNATTMAWAELTIQADATAVYVNVYANNSATVAAGTEYVLVQSISLMESKVNLVRQLNGEYRDSELLPKFVDGKIQYYDSAVPADADMVYEVGDIVWKSNVAAGGSPGWICTTAGAGGTAVFKAMANVAA